MDRPKHRDYGYSVLILFFVLWVVGNLFLAVALALGVIPGSPLVLVAIFLPNGIFFTLLLRGYLRYGSLFRLVREGQGELFDLAISQLIATTRSRLLRDHYRLRRCQGLTLTGRPLAALAALEQYWQDANPRGGDRLRARLAAVEANIALGQLAWAQREMDLARQERRAGKERELLAVDARLRLAQGDAEQAARSLNAETGIRMWPFVRTIRARNLLWYAHALDTLRRQEEAVTALELAIKVSPLSFFGRRAAQIHARLRRGAPAQFAHG